MEGMTKRPRIGTEIHATLERFPTINPSGLFGRDTADATTGHHVLQHKVYEGPRRELDMQLSIYAWSHKQATTRLLKQLYKRTRYQTPSRDRTTSAKRRAGSRRGNGGHTFASDRVG